MPVVVNLDQQGSRTHGLQPTRLLLGRLNGDVRVGSAIPFGQAAGDEIQGVVGTAADVVRVLLHAERVGEWAVGIGLGPVILEAGSVHRSTGEAFFRARDALNRAKKLPWAIAVEGQGGWAFEYQQALALWKDLLDRRSAHGWEVVELADEGASVQAIAKQLRVTEQAVTKRLRAGGWRLDVEGRKLVERLGELALAAAG